MTAPHPYRPIGQPPKIVRQRQRTPKKGFTLVEILVVIAIIGILMGIAIPAINGGLRSARVTAMRLEITSIEGAINKYQLQFGDYPPDFSGWAVVQRHYRKTHPRMSPVEQEILYRLLHTSGADGDITTKTDNDFDATSLDRGEVIWWALGGYSKDIQRPFTGAGGPLQWVGDGTDTFASPNITPPETTVAEERHAVANYQINFDRPNSLMEFEPSRLDVTNVDATLAMTGTNRRLSGDGDVFPVYLARSEGAPYLYFDSRTYGLFDPNVALPTGITGPTGSTGDFNGYGSATFGFARPYLSNVSNPNTSGAAYTSHVAALASWQFVNPNSFQILSAGLDGNFGGTGSFDIDGDGTIDPVYFQSPTGIAIAPRPGVTTPGALIVTGVSKFQESKFDHTENSGADNITNFTQGAIVDDIP